MTIDRRDVSVLVSLVVPLFCMGVLRLSQVSWIVAVSQQMNSSCSTTELPSTGSTLIKGGLRTYF